MKTARNYPLLLASQFLAAFGDNVILALIIGQLTQLFQGGVISDGQNRQWNALFTMLPFIPGVLLAVLAGYVNDRFPKTRWLLGGNLVRLAGSAVAAASLVAAHAATGRLAWQGVGYFIVGIGMCVYGPAKYGILPEILPHERLVKANGTVELLTIIAILLGPVTGAVLVDRFPLPVCYGVLLAIFGASALLNLLMVPTPHDPRVRLGASFGEFFRNFRDLLASPRLRRVMIGTAMFWVCGATLKVNFQPWGLNVLHLPNNTQISLLGLWLGVGIMAGSVLAGQLHRVGDLRWTRRYGWLLALLLVGLSQLSIPAVVVVLLIGIGATAGLFLIPLNAALQHESHPERLGKTIAAQNLTDYFGMCLASAYVGVGVRLGLSETGVFVGLALLIGLVMLTMKISAAPTHSNNP